jgi:DNA primase
MTVSKELGLFNCFNAACGESGTLLDLVMKVKSCNAFAALRLINKYQEDDNVKFTKNLQKALEVKTFPTFDQNIIVKMNQDLWKTEAARDYLLSRGFNRETIDYFQLGYSVKQKLVVTPMHDRVGNPVGVIGRTIAGEKRFQNSRGLPVRETLFNLHRAKRAGDHVVVTESNFDALRVWQAGHECVVASLGGNMSQHKIDQLDDFESVIIFTDDDKPQYHLNCRKCLNEKRKTCKGHQPGLDLGRKIEEALPKKTLYWAHTGGDQRLYGKDAGDMTDEQIRECLENKITRFEARLL